MPNMNRVFLMGNLTRDPELKQIPSGRSVADLGLAVNEKYKNKEGEMVESTCFVDVVAWGKQAENCKQFLAKGAPVLVDGKLQLDTWETEDGQKRSRMRVQAYRIQFLGRNGGAGNTSGDSAKEGHNVDEAGDDDMPF